MSADINHWRLLVESYHREIALTPARLPQDASAEIFHAWLIGFIVLMAWIANRAMDVSARIDLRRFRIDAEENLLARKHVTQIRVLRRAGEVLLFVVTDMLSVDCSAPVERFANGSMKSCARRSFGTGK